MTEVTDNTLRTESSAVSPQPPASWRLIVCGIVAAMLIFAVFKATHPIVHISPEINLLSQAGGVGQTPPIEDMLRLGRERDRVETWNAAVLGGYTGGLLYLLLLWGAGRQGRTLASWGLAAGIGLVLSLVSGALGGWLTESMLLYWRTTEGTVTIAHLMQSYVAAGGLIGAGIGLAFAVSAAHSKQRLQVILGSVFGGSLSAVWYVLTGGVIMTNSQIDKLIGPDQLMQAIWILSIGVLIPVGQVLFSGMELTRK